MRLLEEGEEVGVRVFPADPDYNPKAGVQWWNSLKERERAHWLGIAKSARPVDAWGAFLTDEAYSDALEEAKAWLEARGRS